MYKKSLLYGVECFWVAQKTRVEANQRLKKWYLLPPCLTLRIIRYVSRVKCSNPGKGEAPSPTPWCSNYWRGSLQAALDYGRQLYLTFSYMEWNVFQWSGRSGFNPRSSHTKDSKIVRDAASLFPQHYKVRIKSKVEQSRERSSALPYTSV